MEKHYFLKTIIALGLFSGVLSAELKFTHHYIATDLPLDQPWGWGPSALADFDKDGDLDFAVSVKQDNIYWFENLGQGQNWQRHTLGKLVPEITLGANILDVNNDGWVDLVIGGAWYENPREPRAKEFIRHAFDPEIKLEIHDVAPADVDGDGRMDIVLMADKVGAFWYQIPAEPAGAWKKTRIGEPLHGGFAPQGVADIDGDGDVDITRANIWWENQDKGQKFVEHALPFGKAGRWGVSGRSVIIDLDKDGDNDMVMSDCDQNYATAAWLENKGKGREWARHDLPETAPLGRGSFHSLRVADIDGDGDLDLASKIWLRWPRNANEGREHVDWLENQSTKNTK